MSGTAELQGGPRQRLAAVTEEPLENEMQQEPSVNCVSSEDYYSTWSGHEPEHLTIAHKTLRKRHSSLIFLAGDSSLDNKAWFEDTAEALNGYEEFLEPAVMKTDVCYWLNQEAVRRGCGNLACLNTAIEATTLSNRGRGLLHADEFILDNITSEDYLVVSVGGNDIALKPSVCTILNMLMLVKCSSTSCLRHYACGCLPFLGRCGGSVTPLGCLGCLRSLIGCGCPPGLTYFIDLFGSAIQSYVLRILGPTRPRKVIVCMIYFLDEAGSSWADAALEALEYNRDPAHLQEAIRAIFRLATQRIRIPGTEVVAFPLFEVLDGKCTEDYVSRVEPSPCGGKKMAEALLEVILK